MAKRKPQNKKPEFTTLDMVKASRKGAREAELECEHGWITKHKIHRSKKTYNRKNKHQVKYV